MMVDEQPLQPPVRDKRDGLVIREADDADVTLVFRLIQTTIDSSYAGVYPPRAVDFFKRFHSEDAIRERRRVGLVLVADHEDAVVGTGTMVGGEIVAFVFERGALPLGNHGRG